MTTPRWPTCQDKGGPCPGIQTGGFDRCLAHLSADELRLRLSRLEIGSDLDARGTTISDDLLISLTEAVSGTFGNVDFTNARFTGRVGFPWTHFDGAVFVGAEFEAMEEFGPIMAREVVLDRATFAKWLWIEAFSDRIACFETNFAGGVSLRLLHASVDATAAIFGPRSAIVQGNREWATDPEWAKNPTRIPILASVQETDVSNLVLVDIDLSWCLFAGAHRLDQLRLEGRIWFAKPYRRLRTQRQMLAEEDFARHLLPPQHPFLPGDINISPERVAALYRSLRKAFEDSKNEAGAGDFYYGEMEMRLRSPTTRWAEKWILGAYWLLSGYGQRAGRAVAWLGVLVALVFVLLFTVGLPGEVVWTWGRIDSALRVGMGGVVFREAGQTLTSAGSWTVMAGRFTGPVLLALAVLAIRARVKR